MAGRAKQPSSGIARADNLNERLIRPRWLALPAATSLAQRHESIASRYQQYAAGQDKIPPSDSALCKRYSSHQARLPAEIGFDGPGIKDIDAFASRPPDVTIRDDAAAKSAG